MRKPLKEPAPAESSEYLWASIRFSRNFTKPGNEKQWISAIYRKISIAFGLMLFYFYRYEGRSRPTADRFRFPHQGYGAPLARLVGRNSFGQSPLPLGASRPSGSGQSSAPSQRRPLDQGSAQPLRPFRTAEYSAETT